MEYINGRTTYNGCTRRDYVTQDELIHSLILDKWFRKEDCAVDMIKQSFNKKLIAIPENLIKREKDYLGWKFFLSSENKNALLAMAYKKPGAKKGAKKVTRKSMKHKFTIEDICHNLFEGMEISKAHCKMIG